MASVATKIRKARDLKVGDQFHADMRIDNGELVILHRVDVIDVGTGRVRIVMGDCELVVGSKEEYVVFEAVVDDLEARVKELSDCLARCGATAGMRVDDSPSEIADRVEANAAKIKTVDVVFDAPPSHKTGRFVEVEDMQGKSIRVGDWVERSDGYWALRFKIVDS